MPHDKSHSLGDGANHSSSTIAELNALISDDNIASGGSMPTLMVYVSTNGSDTTGDGTLAAPYESVTKALTSITDASSSKPYCIKIAPGVYTEGVITCKSYVAIEGESSMTSILQPSAPGSDFIIGKGQAMISNVTIQGVTGAIAIKFNSSGLTFYKNLIIKNCLTGIQLNDSALNCGIFTVMFAGADASAIGVEVLAGRSHIESLIAPPGTILDTILSCSGANTRVDVHGLVCQSLTTLVDGIRVASGASVEIYGVSISGESGSLISTACVNISGSGTHCHMQGSNLSYGAVGILTNNLAKLTTQASIIENCTIGYEDGNTGGGANVSLNSCTIINSTSLDINLLNSSSRITGAGNFIDEEKLFITGGTNFAFAHMSTLPGDEGMNIKAELHVGTPERPKECTLGEGDSYIRGLLAYSYNGIAYTDISDDVKSSSGSTFTFPNNSVNTAIYLSSDLLVDSSSDYHKFFGMKMNLATSQTGGTIVIEYWDGAAWSEVTHMTAQSGGQYFSQADKLFTSAANSYQVRFNPFINSDWTKNNDPSYAGGTRYWVRFRITSSPSVLPILEQFKLHANRTEINGDGYMEYMGRARPYRGLPLNWNNFKEAGTSLSDQDLWLSTNCKTGLTNNVFNTNGDNVGTVTFLEPSIDTSSPLRIRLAVVSAATGNLTMTAFVNVSDEGDTISTGDPASTTGEQSDVIIKAVTAGELTWFDFSIDISAYGSQSAGSFPQLVWINIESTNRPGSLYGLQLGVATTRWRDGGHI